MLVSCTALVQHGLDTIRLIKYTVSLEIQKHFEGVAKYMKISTLFVIMILGLPAGNLEATMEQRISENLQKRCESGSFRSALVQRYGNKKYQRISRCTKLLLELVETDLDELEGILEIDD